MPPDKDSRIANAADKLVAHLIPTDPAEDEDTAQERHDSCFELVKSLLER
jgi:gamma-tubulin complex component 3